MVSGSCWVRVATSAADVAGVSHRAEHDVAAILAARRVVERRQRRRRLEDAGDRRSLGQRDVADVLSEEQPRGLRDADDPERSALAERHVVQVHLEDLVLRGACRDDERHPHLEQLAAPRLLPRGLERHLRKHLGKKHVARHLLRDGAAARGVAALAANVRDHGTDNPDGIDAGMLEEAAVLDGEHRLAHAIGNHGERDGTPLFTLPLAERRQHRRVEDQPFRDFRSQLELQDVIGDPRPCRRFLGRRTARRRRTLEQDADDLPLEARRARHDADLAGAHGELAGLLDVLAVRVPEIVQPVDQPLVGERLAAAQLERTREDLRQRRVALTMKARVDQTAECDGIVGRDEAQDDGRHRRDGRSDAHPALAPDRRDADTDHRRFRSVRLRSRAFHQDGSPGRVSVTDG